MNFDLMSHFHVALSDSLHQLQLSFLPPKLQRCHSVSFHYKLQNNFISLAVELRKYYLWESHREYIINIFCYRFIEEMFMEYLLGARHRVLQLLFCSERNKNKDFFLCEFHFIICSFNSYTNSSRKFISFRPQGPSQQIRKYF